MLITPVTLSLIGLAFMLAGMVKSIIGMGLPTRGGAATAAMQAGAPEPHHGGPALT